MKPIIICGVPRAGKSTLANALNKELGFSRIPTDPLVTAFERVYPELGIKHYQNMLHTGEVFAPFANAFLETLPWMGKNFVVEGCHFNPLFFSSKVEENFQIICI